MTRSARLGPRATRRLLATAAVLLIAAFLGRNYLREGKDIVYGVEAYVYGFPLVMMDLTREVSTAVPTAGEFTAPANQFSVMTSYPDASFRAVARTGLDTLFAVSWADLDREPLVLSVPDAGGRYYVIALFDMWSNVFASIGPRTTGTKAESFLIAGPKWQGTAPAEVSGTYRSPTRWVWVNGQMQANGAEDYDVVNPLQKQYKLTPLSGWGQPFTPPAEVPVDPEADAGTPPLERVQRMDARAYFGRLARLLKDNPPAPADGPMVEKLKTLGIHPGQDFDFDALDAYTRGGLEKAMVGLTLLQKGVQKLTTKNGWIVMPANMGNYGTDYMTRAGIALVGLGAIQPRDIAYPTTFLDGEDNALDAAHRYVLHFDQGQTPPTNVGWSISMYDPQGFYVPNSIDRYHLAAWMPLQYNADGSLDIYIQANSPGAYKEGNWLPAPPSGTFSLTIRNFWPKDAALDGSYVVPGVKKVQ